MSMRNFAIYGTGLALTDCKDIEYFNKKFDEKYDCQSESLYDLLENVNNSDFPHEMNVASGDFNILTLKKDYVYAEDTVFFYSKKQPSLFNKAYENEDELINEFKDAFKDLLPEDFDWKKHIGYADWVEFG